MEYEGPAVPWLVWEGGDQLRCRRCGVQHSLPRNGVLASAFVAFLDRLERRHAACKPSTVEGLDDAEQDAVERVLEALEAW